MKSDSDGGSSPVASSWDWSGSFRIDEAGEIGVMVRGLYNITMRKIINIAISLEVIAGSHMNALSRPCFQPGEAHEEVAQVTAEMPDNSRLQLMLPRGRPCW